MRDFPVLDIMLYKELLSEQKWERIRAQPYVGLSSRNLCWAEQGLASGTRGADSALAAKQSLHQRNSPKTVVAPEPEKSTNAQFLEKESLFQTAANLCLFSDGSRDGNSENDIKLK